MEEEEGFEDSLVELNSNKCLESAKDAKGVLDTISKLFISGLNQLSAELLIALALDDHNSLVSFIRKRGGASTHQSEVVLALETVEYLIVNFRKVTEPYFPRIIKAGLYVLHHGSARTKACALKVVKQAVLVSTCDIGIPDLVAELEVYFDKVKQIQPTVLEQMYCVLGAAFEKHPESVEQKKTWFLNKLIDTLHHEVNVAKNLTPSTISGCFEGLNGLLVNFQVEEGTVDKIYHYVHLFCHLSDQKKRVMNRMALQVFQRHAKIFASRIYQDNRYWQNTLDTWIQKVGEDQLSGFLAMLSFYRQMAVFLEKENPRDGAEIYHLYFLFFVEKIKHPWTNTHYRRAALIGVGEFASSCRLYGKEAEMGNLFEMIKKDAQASNPTSYSVFIPAYLECISKCISKLPVVKIEELNYLKRLSVMMIEQYPRIDSHFQPYSLIALEKSFYSLLPCGLQVVDGHINDVIYQGLIRTCAHAVWIDVELQKETGSNPKDLISYKSYLSMWQYLMNLAGSSTNEGVSFHSKKGVCVKVFDSFISSFLKMIAKLDLEVIQKVSDLSDPEFAMEATKPKDFQVFINSVDLFQDVVPLTDSSFLSKWVVKILVDMVEFSYGKPLVSGFYKVIATTLETCVQLDFFDDVDDNAEQEKQECRKLLVKFLEDVLAKADQYKGDLQIACLRTLLAAPVSLVEPFIQRTVPVFQVIVRVGRGYFPLLDQCIATLERWNAQLPAATMKPILQRILPHFDLFLQTTGFRYSELENSMEKKVIKLKSRGKVNKTTSIHTDSRLLTLQKKLLLFLGKLDADVSAALVQQNALPDDTRRERLKYAIPFVDMKPQIHLDELLPRILELSQSCSDRSTRVTACEVLHAVILLLLGNMKQMDDGGLRHWFRRLMRTCLLLGCDSDHVVQQLFAPLLVQITHYFSSKIQLGSKDTEMLIKVLVEGVAHPYDSAVRDFAAKSIREFIVWSIKQLTPGELQQTPHNVRAILRMIYSLSTHPSYNKRLGAAVAFNHIYSEIREEKSILDVFWFELFYYFMESLRMCDESEDKTQILNALKHVKRPLLEQSPLFNTNSKARKIPPCFEGGALCHLIKWAFEQCVDTSATMRRTAMGVVLDLASRVQDCVSLQAFVQRHVTSNVLETTIPPLPSNNLTAEEYLAWLNQNQAVFEFYEWLLKQKAISLEEIKLEDSMKRFAVAVNNFDDTSIHTYPVSSAKCGAIVLFLELLSTLLESCEQIKDSWLDENTWHTIYTCLFRPSNYGFQLHDRNNLKQLPVSLTRLIHIAISKLDITRWMHFFQGVNSLLDLPKVSHLVAKGQVERPALEFLEGLKILQVGGVLQTVLENTSLKMNGDEVVKEVFEAHFAKRGKNIYGLNIDQNVKTYMLDLLKFAVKLQLDPRNVFRSIANKEEIIDEESLEKTTKGEFFMMVHKTCLFQFFLSHPELTIDTVLSQTSSKPVELLISVLQQIYLQDEKPRFKNIVCQIYDKWPQFEEIKLVETTGSEKLTLLLTLLTTTAVLDPSPLGCLRRQKLVFDWIGATFKSKAIDLCHVESLFTLLPHLANFGEDYDENKDLFLNLSAFQASHSLFQPKESPSDTELTTLTLIYKQLFYSLQRTGSVAIFKFIVGVIAKHENLIDEEMVMQSMMVLASQMSPQHLQKIFNLLHDACFVSRYDVRTRLISGRFLSVLLKEVSGKVMQTFFRERLGQLCAYVRIPLQTAMPEICMVDIAKKTSAVLLMQSFYSKLTHKEIDHVLKMSPQIANKALMKTLTYISDAENIPSCFTDPNMKELIRQHACVRFNFLCAVFTSRWMPFADAAGYIFKSASAAFWTHMIDHEKTYKLTIDFDQLPKRKKVLTALRKIDTNEDQESQSLKETLRSIKYMHSQTLFDSTLHDDVTKFDFSHASLRPLDTVEVSASRTDMEVELELDELNKHESMATLIGMVEFMVKEAEATSFSSSSSSSSPRLPSWLDSLLDVIRLRNISENSHLFVLKALYNLAVYIKPFSKDVVPEVLECAVILFRDKPINYLMIDLLVVLAEWDCTSLTKTSKHYLGRLLLQVIDKSDSCRKDIVKHNLAVVRKVIEVWKPNLVDSVLPAAVFERVSEQTQTPKLDNSAEAINYINLHLASTLLANSIPPWTEQQLHFFVEKILFILRHDKKNTLGASEVCGMILAYLDKKNSADCELVCKTVCKAVHSVINDGTGIDVSRLYAVHKHYPKISSFFVSTVHMNAWNSNGNFRAQSLEMLLSHTKRLHRLEDDNFAVTIKTFLLDLLLCNNCEIQTFTLQIFEELIDKMPMEVTNNVADEVIKLQDQRHSQIREWIYKISIRLMKKSSSQLLQQNCKVILLKGLTDPDQKLQEMCLQFWCNSRLQRSAAERMVYIFGELYTPETETGFVGYATRLILEAASLSTEYKEIIFQHPISKCVFQDYHLFLSWRAQHSTIAPMFAQTLTSQLNRVDSLTSLTSLSSLSTQRNDAILLRATIEKYLFQPTAPESHPEENDTFLADPAAKPLPSTSSDDGTFKRPSSNLNRRFMRNPRMVSSYFAKKESEKRQLALEKEKDRVLKRDAHVQMYRSYRIGDFPDIQITHKHILEPLEVLTRKDPQVARLVLLSLHSGVVQYLGDSSEELLHATQTCVKSVLSSGVSDAAMLAFVFHIALQQNHMFRVESEQIRAAAKSSGWLSVGSLLIEQCIIRQDEELEDLPKRLRGENSEEEKNWLHAAELYHSLKQFDLIRGVFLDKLDVGGNVHEAIQCESVLDWQAASTCYETVLESDSNPLRDNFYTQSYLSCLANLSDWSKLSKCIELTVGNKLDTLWSDPRCCEHLLPWFLRSQMMTDSDEFKSFVQQFIGDKFNMQILSSRFSEELALSEVLAGKVQKGNYFLDQFHIRFLSDWTHLDQWSTHLRANKMIHLQLTSELHEMLSILAEKSERLKQNKMASIIKTWDRTGPTGHDDLLTWDIKLSYRNLLLKFLESFDVDLTEITKSVARSELSLVRAGLYQDNFYLSRKYLLQIKKKLTPLDNELNLQREHYLNLGEVLKAKQSMCDVSFGLSAYVKAWQLIDRKVSAHKDFSDEASLVFLFKSQLALGRLISTVLPVVRDDRVASSVLGQVALQLGSDVSEIIPDLKKRALEYLKSALKVVELHEIKDYTCKTYLELAKFYMKFETGSAEDLAKSLLRAMRLGSPEARQMFGCLLCLPQLVCTSELEEECAAVPTWMFLNWTNQLLASLDTNFCQFVQGIVLRIATEFPNAIRCGFRLSKEKYNFAEDTAGQQRRRFVARLSDLLLKNVLQEKFVKALSYIASPFLILKYYLERIFVEIKRNRIDWSHVERLMQHLFVHLYDTDDVPRGNIFDHIAEFREPLESLSREKRAKTKWQDGVIQLINQVSSRASEKPLSGLLKSYSPWLDRFQISRTSLEVPGQYDGNSRPVLKYHVTIASFRSEVLVIKSKCKPIRIAILGNDAAEHKFMLKFGEDLRQDQRIQQLFEHMNHIFGRDKQTKTFAVDTYKVIPFSYNHGIIQWIEDTRSLHDVILESLEKGNELINSARNEHFLFLAQKQKFDKIVTAQLTGYMRVSRDDAIAKFNNRMHLFPWDAFRKSFWSMSTSAEHFVFLRSNFAVSHAAMSVAHWIIGIGDRHLNNTLVSTRTGRALGIDFGYAFGFATQSLKPPELMPFRLTPQIVNLMKPLNESGWIKQTMVHCLRAFRKERSVLLAVLEIFVLEPSWDWIEQAKRLASDQADFEFSGSVEENYQRRKIDMVKLKLEGANPVLGFKQDLEIGHAGHECLSKFIEVLQGMPTFNIRCRIGMDGTELTPEQQVDCLIDLATDSHALSKTYVGWDPWL